MEFKRPGEQPSVIQAYILEELQRMNFQAMVRDSTAQFIQTLEYTLALPRVTL
jgi:hypothetical protein